MTCFSGNSNELFSLKVSDERLLKYSAIPFLSGQTSYKFPSRKRLFSTQKYNLQQGNYSLT